MSDLYGLPGKAPAQTCMGSRLGFPPQGLGVEENVEGELDQICLQKGDSGAEDGDVPFSELSGFRRISFRQRSLLPCGSPRSEAPGSGCSWTEGCYKNGLCGYRTHIC